MPVSLWALGMVACDRIFTRLGKSVAVLPGAEELLQVQKERPEQQVSSDFGGTFLKVRAASAGHSTSH